jgi:protein RecA
MLENERRLKLIETMKQFNKDQKEEVLFFGNEIENQDIISTGINKIDNFLGGGIKRGTHTIIWGGISNGKTTLALQTIANAQKQGLICAYLNSDKVIDNERFDMLGVNRKELIRANCTKNAEQMLTIIKQLCKDKVADLIVVDSINALSPKAEQENKEGKDRDLTEKNIAELARLLSEFCRKVNPDIFKAKCGMIWIGQVRIGGIGKCFTKATLSCGEALKHYAYQIIFMRHGQNADAPMKQFKQYYIDPDEKLHFETVKEPVGHDCVFRMDKSNAKESVAEYKEEHFPFIGTQGFVDFIKEDNEPEIRIDPSMTIEQQEIIKQKLQEKGFIRFDGIMDSCTLIDNPEKETSVVESKQEEEPKKKRGRPKK